MEESDYAPRFPGFWEDPSIQAWNLWGYVDARDVAQAARLSLKAYLAGVESFLIAAPDTHMTRNSMDLVADVYSDVSIRGEIPSWKRQAREPRNRLARSRTDPFRPGRAP